MPPAHGQRLGSFIGAAFGLVYVIVNAGRLTDPAAVVLRVLGVAIFVAVLVTLFRMGPTAPQRAPEARSPYGRAFWLVVAVEVGAIVAGVRVVAGPPGVPQAGVAWVSVVVGVHFFALGRLFRQALFHWLAVAITVCGVAGLVIALTGGDAAPVAVVGGIVPGFLLLVAGLWGTRTPAGPAPTAVNRSRTEEKRT